MKREGLQHGDVLCFTYMKHQNFFERGIRLVEGSRFVHVGAVQQLGFVPYVLEQNAHITYREVSSYTIPDGAEMWCFRPKYSVPTTLLFDDAPYNYLLILDCLINHGMGRLFKTWRRRVMFGRFSRNQICSTLVSYAIRCWPNALPEPDDFANSDQMTPMGRVEL